MDEIVRTDEMAAMLAAPTATPAKIAIVQQAIDTIYGHDAAKFAAAWHAQGDTPQQLAAAPLTAPAADIEPLRQFYATAYYRFIYQTIKSLDSDHLYLASGSSPLVDERFGLGPDRTVLRRHRI